MRSYIAYLTLGTLAAAGLALAQDLPVAQDQTTAQAQSQDQQQPPTQQNRGWRRVGDPAPSDVANQAPNYPSGGPYQGQPSDPRAYDNGTPPQQQQHQYPPQYQYPQSGQAPNTNNGVIPSTLTLKPGTYLSVRIDQALSSDHNHAGDGFSATIVKPVIVDGVVVAAPGQTVGGRVTDAKKAGYVEGTSRLGIALTDMTLVDGANVPVHSQLISRNGPTSVGRDVAAIGGTTALGAAIGAAADWGRGAAIGAAAGAAAGLIGVLVTRGVPTHIGPEDVLTFRVQDPITISTDRSPQSFHWAQPGDYGEGGSQPQLARRPPPPNGVAGPIPAPGPYYYGPGPGYYPYYYGPGVSFYFGGPGYYYHGGGYYYRPGYYYGHH